MSAIILEQGNDFRGGLVNLPVAPDDKALHVTVTSNPSETEPRQDVIFDVQVTDNQGVPVEGEFSLSVVDKASLALADPNSEDILTAYYSEQPLGIETGLSVAAYTGRDAMMPGGMGGGGVGELPFIRENFPDTAYWNPSLITNSEGRGQVTMTLTLVAGCGYSSKTADADKVSLSDAPATAADANTPAPAGALAGPVLQKLDAPPYSYLLLKTTQGETWAAVPQAAVATGANVRVYNPMLMTKFESKALKRTFDELYFGTLSPDGSDAANASGPAMTAAIGGQTQLVISTSLGLMTHVRSSKLRPIAMTSAKRSPAAPDIPTIAESGVPGYEHEPWNGMFAPAGIPKSVLAKINAEVARAVHGPEIKKVFEGAIFFPKIISLDINNFFRIVNTYAIYLHILRLLRPFLAIFSPFFKKATTFLESSHTLFLKPTLVRPC